MTEIVKATRPIDLLRLVPRLVGFRPAESLVLVAFSGRRTGSAMRVDMPRSADPEVLDGVARHLIGMLCRADGVDGVVPVVYTAAPLAAAPRRLIDLLAAHGGDAGLDVKDAFCVGGDGWCRLPDGRAHPLDELGEDHPDLLDQDAELHIPEVGADAIARFQDALEAWRSRSAGPGGSVHGFRPGAGLAGTSFRRAPSLVQRAAAGLDTRVLLEGMLADHGDEEGCPCRAALAAFAAVPSLAEHLLLHIAWGPRFGERVRRSWLLHDEDDLLAEAALTGGEMRRPSPPRIQSGIRAVRAALAPLAPAERGPLLTCAAWFEWALGRGSLAGAFLDRIPALAARPPLALLLEGRLRRGELPEWAFRATPGLSIEAQLGRIA